MQPEDWPVAAEVAEEKPTVRDPFWGWLDLLLAFGLMVGLMVLIFLLAGVAAYILPSLRTDPAPLLLPVQVAFYAAIYLALFLVFHFRYDRPVLSSVGWRQTVPTRVLLYVGAAGALLSPAISAIAALLHTPEVKLDALEQLERYPVILALFGIMAVTVAPLFEEMLFRGFLQPVLSRTMGAAAGIAVTGILFGLLHSFQYKYVWQYVAAISTVGILLGVVRYRTGSIIPTTVMHACFNTVAAIGLFFNHK